MENSDIWWFSIVIYDKITKGMSEFLWSWGIWHSEMYNFKIHCYRALMLFHCKEGPLIGLSRFRNASWHLIFETCFAHAPAIYLSQIWHAPLKYGLCVGMQLSHWHRVWYMNKQDVLFLHLHLTPLNKQYLLHI